MFLQKNTEPSPFKNFFRSFLIWFLIFYLILWGVEKIWGDKENEKKEERREEIVITPATKSVVIGNLATFRIENRLKKKVTFNSPCEKEGSLKVYYVGKYEEKNIAEDLFKSCSATDIPTITLEPNQIANFSLKNFNEKLFGEEGIYKISLKFTYGENEETEAISKEVKVESPGAFRQLFRAIISKPLFNILVFLTNNMTSHSFGWAIVILTFIVRLVLFIPNQKSMKSQRELQSLQPKIEEIKRKYPKDQQMVAMKTMELYKTHKINPMGSCLPILFQMPILFGLYFIVRDGLSPHLNYLLYGFNEKLDLNLVDVNFFGLNLEQNGPWTLAILVGVAQWGAIALSFWSAKKRKNKEGNPKTPPKKEIDDSPMAAMQQANKMMQWILPVLVASFVLSFPSGVGVYWLASTLFGIVQQYFVNRSLDRPQVVRKV